MLKNVRAKKSWIHNKKLIPSSKFHGSMFRASKSWIILFHLDHLWKSVE